ncbi:MAG TPA: preprotein translocase subunit SecE [Actinomycetota bacterium]|nr:preprotein translocase subunit SecE [Actinomycetota bacterium]
MNRQMKRMQERAERQQKRGGGRERQAAPAATARRAQVAEKRKRSGVRQFLREVRLELKKVDWPTRRELVSYTIVVLATLIVTTAYVAGLDYVFSKAILDLLS